MKNNNNQIEVFVINHISAALLHATRIMLCLYLAIIHSIFNIIVLCLLRRALKLRIFILFDIYV